MRATAADVRVEGIPADLKRRPQWVLWKLEDRGDGPTKVPYSPRGRRASSTDLSTWGTFEEVAAVVDRYDGLGFVFCSGDPYAGVDLDGCRDPETGDIEPWAAEIIERLGSYTEVSPSGGGVHILVEGKVPTPLKRPDIEIYGAERYFTITGDVLGGGTGIGERKDELLRLHTEHSPRPELVRTNGHRLVEAPMGNDRIIELCREAKNAPKFERLFDQGDVSGHGHDDSSADLALVGMLAFYTQDPDQLDALFRNSALCRRKWTDRPDYRRRTIERALSGLSETYSPPGRTRDPRADAERPDGGRTEKEDEKDRRNQGDRLIAYALEDLGEGSLFVDQHGDPHALIDGSPVPLNSRCYSWLRRLMWQQEERAVNGEYLKTAAGTLAAQAEFSGEVRELHTRAAWDAEQGALYYELRPGKVVRVGPGGWTFEQRPPVLFRRYPNLKPIPDPEAGGCLDGLLSLVNLKTERDRRLFTAYAVTVPLPHVGRPILSAGGPMGSGKTTAGRAVKRLWDPTAPETVRYDPRDFLQKASHCYVPMLDNLSTLPDSAADTLCRLVTGEADSKRKLYTDDEDVIIELRRAVILNGINAPTDRGDVLDRSLVVELERIPDKERRTEEEIWADFGGEHSRLLGAALDTLARTIARKPSLRLSRRPRLADWGEYAAAVYEVMGWGSETFLSDWDEVVKVQNRSTLDGSPVAQAVIRFMEDRDEYAGTSTELHKKLEAVAEDIGVSVARDKAWPKSARWLWRRVQEVVPLLVAVGIGAERQHTDRGSTIALRKSPPDVVSDVRRGKNRVGKPNTPDDTPPLMSGPNVRNGPDVRPNVSEEPAYLSGSDDTDDTDIIRGAFSDASEGTGREVSSI